METFDIYNFYIKFGDFQEIKIFKKISKFPFLQLFPFFQFYEFPRYARICNFTTLILVTILHYRIMKFALVNLLGT